MEIKELKRKIEEQKEENIRLFKIFEYKIHQKEMQPILEQWRQGSKLLKSLIKQLQDLKTIEKTAKKGNNKPYVNGYKEATKRNITCSTYERSQKRLAKKMLSFIGL